MQSNVCLYTIMISIVIITVSIIISCVGDMNEVELGAEDEQ